MIHLKKENKSHTEIMVSLQKAQKYEKWLLQFASSPEEDHFISIKQHLASMEDLVKALQGSLNTNNLFLYHSEIKEIVEASLSLDEEILFEKLNGKLYLGLDIKIPEKTELYKAFFEPNAEGVTPFQERLSQYQKFFNPSRGYETEKLIGNMEHNLQRIKENVQEPLLAYEGPKQKECDAISSYLYQYADREPVASLLRAYYENALRYLMDHVKSPLDLSRAKRQKYALEPKTNARGD